ncbi:MAG: hypothetical protein QNJ31_05205 [Candidatus Caenarcaniphilales bacterium]|nr:hypothetical protein [Candidatus Caenarcaniphilales bacterium]
MENFSGDFSQPFVFKMPMNMPEQDGVDLKWIGEEFQNTTELLSEFWDNYNNLAKQGKHPPLLLRQQFKIIEALANYQLSLIEHQTKRQNVIQSESDVQEMMNQLENFVKMFRENK